MPYNDVLLLLIPVAFVAVTLVLFACIDSISRP